MTTYTLEELSPDELAALERYRKERDSDNEYTPWISEGITEVQYYHRLYLEMSRENARLKTELAAVLDVCIARGEEAGYFNDDDYQKRLDELTAELHGWV